MEKEQINEEKRVLTKVKEKKKFTIGRLYYF